MFPTLAIAMFAVLAAGLAPWLGADSSESRLHRSSTRKTYPAYPDDPSHV